ncbi:MAG: hypothetical protein HY688_00975 [Chloroflexi bacterium]|nr:hypothetical protein [Chloroflexota bacterium]
MSLAVAITSSLLGWATLAGTAAWYWRTIVPDLYEDQSVLPFLLVVGVASLAYLAVLVGAWRRARGHRDGLPAMVSAYALLLAAIVMTLVTTGVLLLPSFLLATLAAALPVRARVPRDHAP